MRFNASASIGTQSTCSAGTCAIFDFIDTKTRSANPR